MWLFFPWTFLSQIWKSFIYSGTPPYDHPVYKTTLLLRPYSFKPNVKTIESFYYFEDPVNATTSLLRPGFYGPTVVALTGFHCNYTWKYLPTFFDIFSNSSKGWKTTSKEITKHIINSFIRIQVAHQSFQKLDQVYIKLYLWISWFGLFTLSFFFIFLLISILFWWIFCFSLVMLEINYAS